MARQPIVGLGPLLRFHDQQTTRGGTPLDEWSARRRDIYLTTHNTHNSQTSTPPAGVETSIAGSKRLQTHAIDSFQITAYQSFVSLYNVMGHKSI
jgi:hypothetical protein